MTGSCFTESLARMSNRWGQVGHLHNFFSGWIVKWESEAGKWGGTETNLNNCDPLIWKLRQEMSRTPAKWTRSEVRKLEKWREEIPSDNSAGDTKTTKMSQNWKFVKCPQSQPICSNPAEPPLNNNILSTLWPTKLSQICRSSQSVAHNS